MNDVSVQIFLELFEGSPFPTLEELIFDMTEDLLGSPVVDAVALSRHALSRSAQALCWYCQPMSECRIGVAPFGILEKS